MRQVNRDELIYALHCGMRAWSAALRRDLVSHSGETRARAQVLAATALVDRALHRFEVLCATELPQHMGESAFSRPVARLLGEDPGPPVYESEPE